jgi:very-short-patch-repair endonuclease/DNA-directed RNA polymerase subunit RPC12/RpoP
MSKKKEFKYHLVFKATSPDGRHFVGARSTDDLAKFPVNQTGETRLKNIIFKYGMDQIKIEILSQHSTREEANEIIANLVTDEYIKQSDVLNNVVGGKQTELKDRITVVDRFSPEEKSILEAFAPGEILSAAEARYVLAAGIKERPKCPVCGSPRVFKNTLKNYTQFCTNTCRRSEAGKILERQTSERTCLEKYGVAHSFAAAPVKEKIAATCTEKYGTAIYTKTEDFKSKQEAWLAEQGVSNAFQIPEIRLKNAELSAEESEDRLKKRQETCLERYGVDNPWVLDSVKEKCLLSKARNRWPDFVETIRTRSLVPLFTAEDIVNSDAKISFRCNKCGNVFERPDARVELKYLYCPECARKYSSRIEGEVFEFVQSLISDVKLHHRISEEGKVKYEIDIWSPSLNVGFEISGLWYHSEAFKHSNYHRDKFMFFETHGFNVLNIWENEWYQNRKIIKSIITSAVGQSQRYGARTFDIREIDVQASTIFFKTNHLQGAVPGGRTFALVKEGVPFCALQIGKPRWDTTTEVEVFRFANTIGTSVIGGFTRLFSHAQKEMNFTSAVSYRDPMRFGGASLDAAGFIRKGKTDPGYFYFKKNKDGYEIIPRYRAMKHKLPKLLGESFDATLSEHENMSRAGWVRVTDAGQAIHLWTSTR